ncbi:hypothetical protein JCM10212_001100 [Sporobolomyces blumeae]
MPVGHERINAREANPNDNIVFIRALESYPDHEEALNLLKALAAQFKPVMKEWGFGVNSLVEYEPNPTFAGRNWNAGEVIEVVLRRNDGSFLPWTFILYVFCHELAHIREMNHSWAFQDVNKQIRSALATLRRGGYTGDGFWGRGRALGGPQYQGSTAPLGSDGPSYTCGGALRKARRRRRAAPTASTSSSKPRAARGAAVPLGTTGRQTRIAPKAGGRVRRKGAFGGQGRTLGARGSDDEGSVVKAEDGVRNGAGPGALGELDPSMSTKGRRTQSNAARQARSIAAEARLMAERRAQAAEARLRGARAPSPGDDKDVKWRADDRGVDEDDQEGEGRETWQFDEEDEEDKPERAGERFGDDERKWLESEIKRWDEDDEFKVVEQDVGGSSRKRKRDDAIEGNGTGSPIRGKGKAKGSTSKGGKGKGKGRLDDDSDDLADDFSREERALLAKLEKKLENDLHGGNAHVPPPADDSDDDVIIVEPARR